MSKNRVFQNASWIIGCKIAQSLINLIIGMISARYLGPSNYGLINYAASIVTFVVPIMQLGLSKTLVQELIERPDQEGQILGTALLFNVFSAIACMSGVFIFLNIANADEPTTILIGVLYSISLLFQTTEIIQYWFQAKLLSKYTSLASLAAYCLVAIYKVYLLVAHKAVIWFALSNSVDYLCVAIILIITYQRLGKQKLTVSFSLGKEMLNRSKHYIVSAMMVTIFQQTDRIMLKLMLNETETGYYSAAVACVGVSSFVFLAIIDSMRPVILESKVKFQTEKFEKGMIQLYSIITYLALFQCIAMTLFAKPMIQILYGKDFLSSIASLRIAVWYTTFSDYGTIRNIWILAEGKQKYLWIINLSGALMNVFINALLIPRFGAVGAATASLITQFFTNVIIGFIIKPIRYNNKLMIKGLNPIPLIYSIRKLLYSEVSKMKNKKKH